MNRTILVTSVLAAVVAACLGYVAGSRAPSVAVPVPAGPPDKSAELEQALREVRGQLEDLRAEIRRVAAPTAASTPEADATNPGRRPPDPGSAPDGDAHADTATRVDPVTAQAAFVAKRDRIVRFLTRLLEGRKIERDTNPDGPSGYADGIANMERAIREVERAQSPQDLADCYAWWPGLKQFVRDTDE